MNNNNNMERIYIGNLKDHYNRSELETLLKRFGVIHSIEFHEKNKDSIFCFVDMEFEKSSANLLSSLNRCK